MVQTVSEPTNSVELSLHGIAAWAQQHMYAVEACGLCAAFIAIALLQTAADTPGWFS